MNEHLSPIFEKVLPAIEEVKIPYWVYGGIAIAGVEGRFIRYSSDVDVFVLNDDYDRTIRLVADLEGGLKWEHRDCNVLKRKRPKREWVLAGTRREIFSVVPAYQESESVRFIFQRDLIPKSTLTQERRTISTFTFVTPSSEFLKELFILKAETIPRMRKGNKRRSRIRKCRIDAQVILTNDERAELFARLDKIEDSEVNAEFLHAPPGELH